MNCSCNPHKNNICIYLTLDMKIFENVIFLEDFNAGAQQILIPSFCECYNLTNPAVLKPTIIHKMFDTNSSFHAK